MNIEQPPRGAPINNAAPQIMLFSPRERVRDVLLIGLLQCNYRVIETGMLYVAVEKISGFLPDLVIVDITETNTKGFLVAAALGKSDRTRGIPTLLMAPSEPNALLKRIKEEYGIGEAQDNCNTISILNYPFSFADLIKRIQEILAQRPIQS